MREATTPMTTTPLVSVIIATYNREDMLAQTIASVRAQTFTDWELVVVNDGSTDDTRALLDQLASEDARVRPIHQPNRGLAAARNAGIRAARGRYIAIVDDDDIWLPEKLAKQVALHAARPELGFSFTVATLTDERLTPVKVFPELPENWSCTFAQLLQRNWVPLPTAMIRRDCLLAVGGFDEHLSRSTDYDLWLRLGRRHPFECVRESLCLYRRHGANMSLEPTGRSYAAVRIFQKLLEDREPGIARVSRSLVRCRIAQQHYRLGRAFRDRREFGKAARHFALAVRSYPLIGLRAPGWQTPRGGAVTRLVKSYLAIGYCFLRGIGHAHR